MYPEFKFSKKALHRLFYGLMAALLLAVTIPLANMMNASAYTQLGDRKLTLNDSSVNDGIIISGIGSGKNVTYGVGFTYATIGTVGSIKLEFCDNSPIIGLVCNAPTGFSASSAVLSAQTGNTGFTILSNTSNSIVLTRTASNATATASTYTFTNVNNPSATGTYFMRIQTFTSTDATGNSVDAGGVAFAITNAITITAKVQETLSFCVTSAAHNTWTTTNDCSDSNVASNLPALTIGHGSPNIILDSSAIDTGFVYTQLSTNAINGAIIRLRGGNSCGGLSNDGGTNCPIPGIGSAAQMTAGTANFGLFVSNSVAGPNGVGSLTADANYNDTANINTGSPSTLGFGMDNANVPNTSTYGDTIATSAGPVYRANITNVFGATAALTTPAGIYSNNYSMIATGTF